MAQAKNDHGYTIFELDDMYALFKKEINVDIRKSRFKKKLLEKAPELTEISTSSQRVLLVYKDHIGDNINVNKSEENENEIYAKAT